MSIHLTRIYTRGGDQGKTSLATGERVDKDHPRLEGYGTSDELCCLVGKIRTLLADEKLPSAVRERTLPMMTTIQDRLFDLGTVMATTPGKEWPKMPGIRAEDVQELESWIDSLNEDLQPLSSFVLPGGSLLNAETHLARAVCRRLERLMCHLVHVDVELPAEALSWVNRLSDFLFVVSRWYSLQENVPEYLWSQRAK